MDAVLYVLSGIAIGSIGFFIYKIFSGNGESIREIIEKTKRLSNTPNIEVKIEDNNNVGTKKEDLKKNNTSSDTAKKMRDKFKASVIFAAIILSSYENTEALPEKSKQSELEEYLDNVVIYTESVEKEFDDLRKNSRNDTELHIVERTENSMLVEIRIPTKEPLLREDKVEQKKSDPIVRKIRILSGGNYKLVYDNGFFIEPIANIGFSIGSHSKTLQPNVSLELLNWGNEYLRIGSGFLVGSERYGIIVSVGPARYLSNIRFLAGYSRTYNGSQENNIEVGISSSIYMK